MISLSAQIAANIAANHNPVKLFHNSKCKFKFTVGEFGEVIAWDSDYSLVYQMNPSINGDVNRLEAINAFSIKCIDQTNQFVRIMTVHSDRRLRVWSMEDGICLNISEHNLFEQKVVALLAPSQIETKFIIALCEESFYLVDCWLLKPISKIYPQKESYSKFVDGSINEHFIAQFYDHTSKLYQMNLSSLFQDHYLDFGAYINNFDKACSDVDLLAQTIKHQKTEMKYFNQPLNKDSQLAIFKKHIEKIKNTTLIDSIFSSEFLEQNTKLRECLKGEIPEISTLNFIGSILFLFVGTSSGKVYAFPAVHYKSEKYIILKVDQGRDSPIKYLREFNRKLFVSWESGHFSIYNLENMKIFLQKNRSNQYNESLNGINEASLNQLCTFDCLTSSYVKYILPIYKIDEGKVDNGMYSFRLNRNEVIIYNEASKSIKHYRGISQDLKIYCVCLIEEYVGVCSSKGVDLYSEYSHERLVDYSEWNWQDYKCFLSDKEEVYESSHYKCHSVNSMLKFDARIYNKKVDYCEGTAELIGQTFGKVDPNMPNEYFPQFFFIQKGQIEKTINSYSNDNIVSVLKVKLNNLRRVSWTNTTFLLFTNLNQELDHFLAQSQPIQSSIDHNFQFYSLFDWHRIKVPFFHTLMQDSKKVFTLRQYFVMQGVGKSFTVYFQSQNRSKLSHLVYTHEAVCSISFFQCCVLKRLELTDQMVEAVQYFSSTGKTCFGEKGYLELAKFAVTENQNIAKACINLLISWIIESKINVHPIFQYFILNEKVMEETKNKLLSYNETVWLVYLGLCIIFSEQKLDKEQNKFLIPRIVGCIELSNFEMKPEYLLIVMKIFNEGISNWKDIISSSAISKLLVELFKVFFYYDGLTNLPPDDKKFNYCFAHQTLPQKKLMKQNIVKTLIYISKEFSHQFHQALKDESINQKVHLAYPASVIEILRQYLKSEKPLNHQVFYVELLLQCLSPMTPNLRKFVQKSALNTLQLMCTYDTISFNQPSQKLSVKTHNHLYIYCLRTSTKWRTINIKDEKKYAKAIIQMSPKGTYIALLSDKLRVWRLSSGFWSGVLGAFSQDWNFDVSGNGLKWEESEETVTVLHEDPSCNRSFKL